MQQIYVLSKLLFKSVFRCSLTIYVTKSDFYNFLQIAPLKKKKKNDATFYLYVCSCFNFIKCFTWEMFYFAHVYNTV